MRQILPRAGDITKNLILEGFGVERGRGGHEGIIEGGEDSVKPRGERGFNDGGEGGIRTLAGFLHP